jgi:hypothetical protein
MKLQSLSLLIAATLASSVNAMPSQPAELSKADLAGYYSSQHPHAGLKAALANSYPATDITVVNATDNVITMAIPNAFSDYVQVEANNHLRHQTLVAPTHLNLLDPYGNVFFDQYVCRLAVVTAYGQVGSYRINVDTEYCNRP